MNGIVSSAAARSVRECRFEPRPESAAEARRFVGGAVKDTRVDRGDVMLLASELVNNAIVHSRGTFEVRVCVEEHAVYVAVVNHAPELLLMCRAPSADGGRGLHLLDTVASAWGFERGAERKLVWFRLAA